MPLLRGGRGLRATACAALGALMVSVAIPAGRAVAEATPIPPGSEPGTTGATASPAARSPRPRVLLFDWGPGAAADAAQRLRATLATRNRFVLSMRDAALDKLKASRAGQRALANATAFTDAGRASEMSLQWAPAEAAYRRALEALDEALVRFYDAEAVARLHLALGAVAFHQGQREQAHDEFRRGLTLWPDLEPDRSYNPQVRAAFDVARGRVPPRRGPRGRPQAPMVPPPPPPPPPSAAEAGRLCAAVGVDAVVVVEEEAATGRHALRASLYVASRRAYVAVETRAFPGDAPTDTDHEALAGRLAEALDTAFPPPRPSKPPVVPPPPSIPWYKRWWVWVVAGAVVATTVTVPVFLLQRDTVRVVVPY
jgi:tetratricopeptide (TPR) repeat protein